MSGNTSALGLVAGKSANSSAVVDGPKPIFGYWNIRAMDRGNVNRYIFAYAGVEYEDKRYTVGSNEWFEDDKKNLGIDYPNLPYIIDGDFKLTESAAVTTYICDKWCPELLGGKDSTMRIKNIQLQSVLKDFMTGLVFLGFSDKDMTKAAEKKAFDELPKFVEHLGNKKFLLGSKVQMVDFMFFEAIEAVLAICHNDAIFSLYPKLEAYWYRMKALPGLCEYINSDKFLAEPFFIPAIKINIKYPFAVFGEERPLVTITGITGYVGSHVARQFLQDGGFRVRGTVRDLNDSAKIDPIKQAYGEDLFSKMELVQANLTDDKSLSAAVAGSTYVVHVASPVDQWNNHSVDDFVKPAVNGTLGVLRACR